MYEDMRRERFLRMQTLTRPSFSPTSTSSRDSQARTIAVIAVMLFALSGLITGFAFGAFVHFAPPKTSNPTTGTTSIVQKSGDTTPTATKIVQPAVPLGWPEIIPSAYTQIADGSTSYSVKVQVTDQSKGQAIGKAIQASGITCKIWLTNKPTINTVLKANNNAIPRSINTLQQPFPDEAQGGLVFSTDAQAQMCNANGQATWHYTLSPSLDPGSYLLAAITDWNGTHYNWSWVTITIKKAS